MSLRMTEHPQSAGELVRRNDPRPTVELIRLALDHKADDYDDVGWNAVVILHYRATREVLEAAQKLCMSLIAKERVLGADILGQLGVRERAFPEESVTVLLDMLNEERDPDVLCSVGVALGHQRDPRAIEPLCKLKNHPDDRVRFGVVIGLLTYEDSVPVETLVELSRDSDLDVRNWATFGLGSQISADSPGIRQALVDRLIDRDPEVRGEALLGLARRKDQKVLRPLIEELASEKVLDLAVEAAVELASPELEPVLLELAKRWTKDPRLLRQAIDACSRR